MCVCMFIYILCELFVCVCARVYIHTHGRVYEPAKQGHFNMVRALVREGVCVYMYLFMYIYIYIYIKLYIYLDPLGNCDIS